MWRAAQLAQMMSRPGKGKAQKKGSSWMVVCPVHTDQKPSLNLTDGRKGLIWHCHAGCSQEEVGAAIRSITSGHTPSPTREAVKTKQVIEIRSHRPTIEDLRDIGPGSFFHFEYGDPASVWIYKNREGLSLFYVARYETPDGKEIVPWSWYSSDNGPVKFGMKAWPKDRPLYNLDKIAARPDAPVLYVEGEKAVAPAERLFPNFVVTTHQGGSKALEKTDFSSLRGRLVIIQPDADEPGKLMAERLAIALDGIARKVLRLDWPKQWPDAKDYVLRKGDDCFDHEAAGWTRDHLVQLKEAGKLKLVEQDSASKFGEGEPGEHWAKVMMRKDETCALVCSGNVVASVTGKQWRAVVPWLEADFNRRLEANRAPHGRFPRWEKEVDVAPFMVAEIYGLMKQINVATDPESALMLHIRMTPFARSRAWKNRSDK
jgi:hypothetical protein